MNVILNDAEQKLSEYLAKKRYNNARKKMVEDKKIGPQSCSYTDLNGIGAEVGFCKLFNIYPDTQTEYIPVTDGELHTGHSVDVKCTKYHTGHLIAVITKKGKPCDLYALMIGEMPNYRFAGFSTPDSLFMDENIKDLGHGDGYCLAQESLMKVVYKHEHTHR